MNRLCVFAIFLIAALAGSEAFLFNVTVNTGFTHFSLVNGSLKLTVMGRGCGDTYFVLAE